MPTLAQQPPTPPPPPRIGTAEGAMDWLLEIVRSHGQDPRDDEFTTAEYRAVGWVKEALKSHVALKRTLRDVARDMDRYPSPPA